MVTSGYQRLPTVTNGKFLFPDALSQIIEHIILKKLRWDYLNFKYFFYNTHQIYLFPQSIIFPSKYNFQHHVIRSLYGWSPCIRKELWSPSICCGHPVDSYIGYILCLFPSQYQTYAYCILDYSN